ncbi:MAG: hypothetical protein EZS28_028979 [Streblomastix strix]|uniref:Uncharacterized protein n=1 Tax=Streblomastix strix TaxID=222440 RepID=A0A5J4UZ35_9EUKA|nr:MAG: hypothetical protein EZS28_028979 [Streblomastix strix]
MRTKLSGGIAILAPDVEVPREMLYGDMINLKGVIFTLPDIYILSSGPLKAYKTFHADRIGQGITQFIQWNI